QPTRRPLRATLCPYTTLFRSGETEPRDAQVLAADPGNDLALIRLDDTDGASLTPAVLADAGRISLGEDVVAIGFALDLDGAPSVDRKSTRLNSSHVKISYAAF